MLVGEDTLRYYLILSKIRSRLNVRKYIFNNRVVESGHCVNNSTLSDFKVHSFCSGTGHQITAYNCEYYYEGGGAVCGLAT